MEEGIEEKMATPKKDRFLPISIVVAAILIGGSVVFATMYKSASPAPVGGVPARAAGGRLPPQLPQGGGSAHLPPPAQHAVPGEALSPP